MYTRENIIGMFFRHKDNKNNTYCITAYDEGRINVVWPNCPKETLYTYEQCFDYFEKEWWIPLTNYMEPYEIY